MKYTEEEWVALNNAVLPKQEYPELEGTLAICNDIINKGKMNKGILHKKENKWFITRTEEGEWETYYPIHQQHSFWLKIFGEEGMELAFERQGDEVILKANGPDTHEYVQD
jgi:hypothetical protein